MSDITTREQLLQAYRSGQRYFEGLELEITETLTDAVLSGAVFRHCWLNVDFIRADLTSCQFLECSLKTADFSHSNLTNATIQGCTVEDTRFSQAIVTGFVFEQNSAYGQDTGQQDFDDFIYFF
ncbi:pentapeptide repeat-containing protein [Hymenobacter sp. B81]|uniref:pentapeptide repeat-containing protein n=1 Tax=Hymenobacter sp. B81 TaxID=3344878 RepID=UPI0037DC9B6B